MQHIGPKVAQLPGLVVGHGGQANGLHVFNSVTGVCVSVCVCVCVLVRLSVRAHAWVSVSHMCVYVWCLVFRVEYFSKADGALQSFKQSLKTSDK